MQNSVTNTKRVFKHKENALEDINPALEPQAVLDLYATQYPELTSAHIVEKEVTPEKITYEFVVETGRKG